MGLCLLTYCMPFRKSKILLNTQEFETGLKKMAEVIHKTNAMEANLIKLQTITSTLDSVKKQVDGYFIKNTFRI